MINKNQHTHEHLYEKDTGFTFILSCLCHSPWIVLIPETKAGEQLHSLSDSERMMREKLGG